MYVIRVKSLYVMSYSTEQSMVEFIGNDKDAAMKFEYHKDAVKAADNIAMILHDENGIEIQEI